MADVDLQRLEILQQADLREHDLNTLARQRPRGAADGQPEGGEVRQGSCVGHHGADGFVRHESPGRLQTEQGGTDGQMCEVCAGGREPRSVSNLEKKALVLALARTRVPPHAGKKRRLCVRSRGGCSEGIGGRVVGGHRWV